MHEVNEFLATGPFDIYELQLFHLVAEHQSFTKAGRAAGLTQSAITRQIRGMEDRLGVALFERTTRLVRLTPAGAALHARSGTILSEVNNAISAIRDGFHLAPKTLKVGISKTIGLAYLPGFFHQFQRKFPDIKLNISHETGAFVLSAVESGELDAGIVTAPPQLSGGLTVTHRFIDEFTTILPSTTKVQEIKKPIPLRQVADLLANQQWIFVSASTVVGKLLRGWLTANGAKIQEIIEADNFDLITNLVSLGVGVSIVPHRTLALQGQRRPVKRLNTDPRFKRELIVVIRKQAALPEHVKGFVENILF